MVAAVRKGLSVRAVARQFGVGKSTVQRWVEHAAGQRLDRVDFASRPPCPLQPVRTPQDVEALIVQVRQQLQHHSDLGEHGAEAIRRELVRLGLAKVPSVRTVGRVLERQGLLDGRRRTRRPAPPRGWHLPDVAAGQEELDSFDFIEDLRIQDGPLVNVLTGISLHGRLAQAWPQVSPATARGTLEWLLEHWLAHGRPRYAQFDNDTRFQGAHHQVDALGRIVRLCMALEIVPVFAPPQETGFQAQIEHFNRRWQDVVWHRFHHDGLPGLCGRSQAFLQAHARRHAPHRDQAPLRRPVPQDFHLDLQRPPTGRLIYIRRCSERGEANLLGRRFPVDRHWPHRLVRCEVDLDGGCIRFFALRRREPAWQPLLAEVPHRIPCKRFRE